MTLLGAGTAIPAPGYSPSGLYVRAGSEHLLLDAGAGTLQRLHRIGVTFLQLDRLFITHLHPDHCLDLVSLLFAMRIPEPARRKPFAVYGPRGVARLHRALDRTFRGWLEPDTYRLTVRELGETSIRLRGGTVRTRWMNHSTATLGYRIDAKGKSVAYSGDTDVCDGLVGLGRGADLLILECSMPDERKTEGHLTPTACGQIAALAGCRHLVLTHFYPVFTGYDIRARVRRHYRGRLTLAKDLTSLTI